MKQHSPALPKDLEVGDLKAGNASPVSSSEQHPPLPAFRKTVMGLLGSQPVPPVYLQARVADSHKGDFGRILVVGGSRGMAGSIALSSICCLKSGAGLVTAAVPDRCLETVASVNPCIMTMALADDGDGQFDATALLRFREIVERFDVIVMGPGMGVGVGANRLVESAIKIDKPLVLDADGLNVLSQLSQWQASVKSQLIITPHPGEFQRLSGVVASDRSAQIRAAKAIAAEVSCIVVLKGAETFVTDGNREYVNQSGNPGMATGGSGDCLTGLVGALLGQSLSGFEAAVAGVWTHGLAGDLAAARLGQPGVTALDIAEHLPWAVACLAQ